MEGKLRSTPKGVSVSSGFVAEYEYPGIALVRMKLDRLVFWNRWRERFKERFAERRSDVAEMHGKCLNRFLKNSQMVIDRRVYFDRWKRMMNGETLKRPSKQYLEFMSELQDVTQSIAHYQTTVDVLDAKIGEMKSLYKRTRKKAKATKSELVQASDKYDALLKMVAEKKIEHRDLVANLQLQLGALRNAKKNPVSGSVRDPEIRDRLARDHAMYHNSMNQLKKKFDATRQKALELRVQIDEVQQRSEDLDREIERLAKERDEIGDVEESVLLSTQRPETVRLMKLLKAADEQLKESAETIEHQNRHLRDLDIQIRTKRNLLEDLE